MPDPAAEPHPPDREPRCPRCRYDLQGEVDTWTDDCPIEGRCSECGYEFRWGDLLHPRLGRVHGFYDHAEGSKRDLLWAWRTGAWIAWPPLFWRRVGLHHLGSSRLAIVWLARLLVPLWIAAQLVFIAHSCVGEFWHHVVYATWSTQPLQYAPLDVIGRALAQPVFGVMGLGSGRLGWYWPPSQSWPAPVSAGLAFALGATVVLGVAPTTRRRARVRLTHVARAAIYSIAWLVPLAVVRLVERLVDLAIVPSAIGPGWSIGPWADVQAWLNAYWWPVGIPIIAWQAWWWWVTLRRGWRVSGSTSVWVGLSVVGVLAAACAVVRHHAVATWFTP
ncbi:MAG: hypothetical protein AAGK04_08385 [Planctomycetota bacterium]